MSAGRPRPLAAFAAAAVVVAAVFACFLPALRAGFVDWDDELNLTGNPFYRGLSARHLAWMVSTVHGGHWQPLSWLTLAVDHAVYGMEPFGYHLTNVALHAATAVACFFLIRALIGPQAPAAAAVGALVFAIHPLRVESVAWVSERRDVLSGLFWVLTVLAYVRMTAASGAARAGLGLASLGAFVLSLGSKAWGITLPVVLLVLDVYPLRRVGREPVRRLLLEKVPWAVLAVAAGAGAFLAQHPVEAMRSLAHHGVLARAAQAAYGLCFYPWKTLVPLRLSPLYLLELELDPFRARYLVAMLGVVAVTVALVALRRRWPWALAAWVCYAVIVSPVLGVVQTGPQLVADRYAYLAGLPFAVVVAAGLARAPRALPFAMVAVAVLGFLTFGQAGVWRDSRTLWEHALRLDPDNFFAQNNLGNLETDPARSFARYDAAIRTNPRWALAWYNRGNTRHLTGDYAGAVADLTEAIRLKPGDPQAWNNRGWARQAQGDWAGAAADYARALEVAPRAWNGRALIEGNLATARQRLAPRTP